MAPLRAPEWDVSPHGWGIGLPGHAHVCQAIWAIACVFVKLVRGFWGAVLCGGPGSSSLPCTGNSCDPSKARHKQETICP